MTTVGVAVLVGMRTGLLVSAVTVLVSAVGFLVARDFMLDSYPPAVRRRYGEQSRRGRLVANLVAVAYSIAFFVFLIIAITGLRVSTGQPVGFPAAFIVALSAAVIVEVVEFVAFDWLMLGVWRPEIVVLPGTAGMAEYGSLRFRLRPIELVRALTLALLVAVTAAWLIT